MLCSSVGPSIRWFMSTSREVGKRVFVMPFIHVCGGRGKGDWGAVGAWRPRPTCHVSNEILLLYHLFIIVLLIRFLFWKGAVLLGIIAQSWSINSWLVINLELWLMIRPGVWLSGVRWKKNRRHWHYYFVLMYYYCPFWKLYCLLTIAIKKDLVLLNPKEKNCDIKIVQYLFFVCYWKPRVVKSHLIKKLKTICGTI